MTLAEAVETIREYCRRNDCAECVFLGLIENLEYCSLRALPTDWKTPTGTNIYDKKKEEKEK